ncbi:ATP-binding protein [Rhodoferax sp.]|uniref:ATP-binding protein n=1 Tax=Rhodoferax sp. TaxID=50421 RepID=UPI00277743CD|nr:ATP-binding protein [Rhodoferax sp.]
MYPRLCTARLRHLASQFPAVLILGARQVGKTTLARQTFSALTYLDLEDHATHTLFAEDPRFQLDARAGQGLILDEAQRLPPLFDALRGAIDADRQRMGRFVILGSSQPSLVRQVAESLAGRVGILELSPLTVQEAATGDAPITDYRQLWLCGGYPDAVGASSRGGDFRDWWEAYLRTYVERDLPVLGVNADPLVMRKLLTMLAHAQGGLANLSQFAAALGLSQPTVARYVDILEQSFLLRRLPPYFRNVGKRLVKAPKLYLRDTGLLHHLLNIDSLDALGSHPIRGASWETFVLEDLLRREAIAYPHSVAHFWRTAGGAEVDLLLQRDARLHAVEIKTARASSPYLARGLRAIMEDTGAVSATILDQGAGTDPLAPGVMRRGFGESVSWLPAA